MNVLEAATFLSLKLVQWATVASAVFAAVAAVSAAVAAGLSLREQRAALQPLLVSALLAPGQARVELKVVNAGAGLANATHVFGTAGEEAFAVPVGDGMLKPGDEWATVIAVGVPDQPFKYIVTCRDPTNRLHIWRADGFHRSLRPWSRRRRRPWPAVQDLFRAEYPREAAALDAAEQRRSDTSATPPRQ
jgi:hypothetical protein